MATEYNGPMYPPGPGYPPPNMPSNQGRGLALTGLILGIVALALCWIPVINLFALILALAGLGFSIAALVIAIQRRTTARGLAIAGLVVSAVAAIASLVLWLLLVAFVDSVNEETENSGTTDPSASPGDTGSASPSADVLPLGEAAVVGEYTVAVTAVQPDATESILGVNEVNEPPEGQYVLVSLDVVYNGTEEGDPWLDLTTAFVGSDARQYDETTCMAVVEREASQVPTLEPGGQASYDVCMDVPAAAVPGTRIQVEETLPTSDITEASWRTQ